MIGRCLRVRFRVRVSGRFGHRCSNFLPVRSVRPVRCFIAPRPDIAAIHQSANDVRHSQGHTWFLR